MIDQQTVLALIRAALSGSPGTIPEDFRIDEYFAFARAQQLEAILITGLHKSGFAISKELRNVMLRANLICSRQNSAAQQLYAAFEKNKIDYMPLKGSVIRPLYPSEELRSMADIDILIRTEQYEQIHALMLEEGYAQGVESDHEYVWDKDGIHVELHKRLIPSYNKDYYAYYGEGWQLAKPIDGTHCFEMSREDTLIYLLTHYAKHYRDAGAGIRQALDIYVYRRAYPDIDENYVQEKLRLLQLERFYENTLHMLDVWFGTAEHTEASKLISDRLFSSGVFGSHESSMYSATLKKLNNQGSMKKVKARNWFGRLFVSYSGMCQLYPCLKKFPFLLPLMWVVRWVNILLHKRNRLKTYVQEDNMLTDDSVEAYHEMLRTSGLDFNFK